MPTLADLLAGIDSVVTPGKRRLADLLRNPLAYSQQALGNVGDNMAQFSQNALRAQEGQDLTRMGSVMGDAPQYRNALAATMNGLMGVAPIGVTKVRNLKGELVDAPQTFWRGETPGANRVHVGNSLWDKHLFAADNEKAASLYGENLIQLKAKPEAKIAYEGSKEFSSMMKGVPKNTSLFEYAKEATKRALENGYDAVWFKRQQDLGTAINNRNAFDISGDLINNDGGLLKK